MLYAMRKPAVRGLKVDGVTTRDMAGLLQHTMRILGNPVVCDDYVPPMLGTFTT